ncbi:hypothetical protein GR925_19680 [Streptomyces sp. HUCO-GS316]|uniref:hypothetical protein n=1 Tax=Streptomyces sp. HUCO-GS316 TaxID=2692198 RepID=UPI0013716E66|nr:hypothetical protein [Streptomyces sp. HUCO-GS316]MXM65612.1 hypothetical protein [Streptomyces sp. HUCO-GS316]
MIGRRTTGWYARTSCGRPSLHARVAAVGAVLCAAALLPGPTASAAGTPGPYGFAEDARSVQGATSTTDAERLRPGTTYTSSLPTTGKLYYSLELDATSNAYVSATAVPPEGTTVSASDGIRVSVQDANGSSCSFETASVGSSRSPHPITAVGAREAKPSGTLCQGGGTYYVVVERVARTGASPAAWDLELTPVLEPRLERTGETSAPEAWNSASPAPLTGGATRRAGGTGFASARLLTPGVWRDDIRPGQTLFYRVPVDWGRQLYATADLGSASSGDRGFVPGALDMSLYNPVRDKVEDAGVSYDGSQKSAVLDPLPPVAYPNRYAAVGRVNTMRFAGSYYLVVHLAAQVADEFGDVPIGLKLRVRVEGATEAGPGYSGQSAPEGLFGITAQDRAAAPEGHGGAGGEDADATMKLIAAGGIGTGTVLLAVLGVWTVVARRRAGAGA